MPLFESLLFLLDEEPHTASLNMAIDEIILKESSVPTLRVYRWIHPAASFGYFEKYVTVKEQHGDRDLVRRWTGGGVVLHGEDYTYSLMVPHAPESSSFLQLRVAQSYGTVHEWIVKTMRESGVPVSMAQSASPKISQACFENAVTHDVLLEGRKIAGAAQRRSKFGLLHQGSIQCAYLPSGFGEKLATNLGGHVVLQAIGQSTVDAAKILAGNKYATPGWLGKF